MVETAGKKLGGAADLRLGDAENLPFGDNSFDIVICNDSFHHYPDPGKALSEFMRVLRPGGTLLLSDYCIAFPLRLLMNLFIRHGHDGDVHIYSKGELSALTAGAGFSGIQYDKAGSRAFIMTARKPGTRNMDPEQFYKDEAASLTSRERSLTRKSNILAGCRLILFFGIAASIWCAVRSGGGITGILLTAASLILYMAAMKADGRLGKKAGRIRARKKTCENESACLRGDFTPFADGAEFTDLQHEYSYDLDIFGPASLFQRINRTITQKGKEALASRLTTLPAAEDIITRNREAVEELAGLTQWRIRFISNGHIGKDLDRLSEGIGQIRWKKSGGIVPYIFAGITILALAGWISGLIAPGLFCSLFLIQLLAAAIAGRRTNMTMQITDELHKECNRYLDVLKEIEIQEFRSDMLKRLRQSLFDKGSGSLAAFAELSRILNLYDQRGNFLMYILLNGTVMYDMLVSRMFIGWVEKYGRSITGWTSCIAEIDALASLGTYAFNNPENTRAEILGNGSETIIEAEDVIHPFLAGGTGVPNSFRLGRQNIAIVTGANMAGKSTFLRTIGVSYILAANGVPVCARRFAFTPVSLFSSMRTTDNLAEGTSYFQTELLRLKQMLEHVKTHPYTLVILDEILKGTNSADKLKGSMLVLNELSRQQISGIVATHDLGITELEKSRPERFTNYCFEIELSGEILYSYKIRRGVARNMNASYLIEKILDSIQ